MENTPSSLTQTTTEISALEPDVYELGLALFSSPRYRPAVFDEIYDDAHNVIDKIARTYTDATCPELQYDELQAEGRKRLAILVDKGFLERTRSRHDFFKCFAAAFKRAACSLVQRYRFTEKRTGVKPPKRGERFTGEPRMKTVEVHTDDPDCNVQVADTRDSNPATASFSEILEDYSYPLSEVEKLVMKQLVEPNELAWAHCYVESRRNKYPDAPIKMKMKHDDLAYGIGMSIEQFSDCVLSIQQKIEAIRSMSDKDYDERVRRNAALAQLAQIFNLQIPPVEDIVIRRMLTLAARDQFDKVTPEVQEMLAEVGAVVPVIMGKEKVLSCYGVLHSKNSPRCASCGIRKPCETKAVSVGLDQITPSPALIGSRNTRIPVVSESSPVEESPKDMEIMAYLDENFERGTPRGRLSFRHRDGSSNYIFQADRNGNKELMLKFISPSKPLAAKLTTFSRAYVAPAAKSAADVIALIDQHAKETMNG